MRGTLSGPIAHCLSMGVGPRHRSREAGDPEVVKGVLCNVRCRFDKTRPTVRDQC